MIRGPDGVYVDAPFHHWFGLTYSSYLVLPRSILEALPLDLQERMIAVIDEARDLLDTDQIGDNYSVQLRGEKGRFLKDPFANYRHPVQIPFRKVAPQPAPKSTLGDRRPPATVAREHGWKRGTLLVGDEGYGPDIIQITALGEESLLAKAVSRRGEPVAEHNQRESSWTLEYRDWVEVPA